LKGFNAELAVISGRAGNVAQMQEFISAAGPDPAGWLPLFLDAHSADQRQHSPRREHA